MHPRENLYPGYDVLAKHDSPSWNAKTRAVLDERLALGPNSRRFFDAAEWATLTALAARIVPQPADRAEPVPVAALVDEKMARDDRDGFRDARLPLQGEAWRRGLKALDTEAKAGFGARFHELGAWAQDQLLKQAEKGDLTDAAWAGMPSDVFFKHRLLPDVVKAYYAHPTAWNEIGWGGPASPRGYVRMGYDRRDPWEAAEAKPGREDEAFEENLRIGE